MKKILNLGCGTTRIPNSIGVDSVKVEGFVDVVHDLNKTPYPFKANSIDEIHMYHVLEHLDNPVKKLEELYRILKPNGILYIRVPHFSSLGAFTDITHIRPFAYSSFDCLQEGDFHHYYTTANFKILNKQIKFFGLYPNEGVYAKYIHKNQCHWALKPLVRLINYLIALSPTFFERLWCYYVGGAMELVITLKKSLK
jgi:SAM-dependent methyltransferase